MTAFVRGRNADLFTISFTPHHSLGRGRKRSRAMVRWAKLTSSGLALDHLLQSRTDGHIWQVAQGCSRASPNQGKSAPKRYLTF